MMAHEGEIRDANGRPIAEPAPAPRTRTRTWVQTSARAGVSMGSALAIAISWSEHHSILWAIIHGFLSWLYVAWFALTR
jgi:hypothetical protein